MKYLLTTLFIILTSQLLSQNSESEQEKSVLRIISKNGLELKSGPDENSRTLLIIPYWTKVDPYEATYIIDTIRSTFGKWIKINYNQTEGFLFDGFLIESCFENEKQKDVRIFHEGGLCASINFDPTLNWYGIYKTKSGDSLIKVDIEISKPSIERLQEIDGGGVLIRTNLSGRRNSKFLIGSRKNLDENILNSSSSFQERSFLPGQFMLLYGQENPFNLRNCVYLYATGCVIDTNSFTFPNLENYHLRIGSFDSNTLNQDISDEFNYKGTHGMVEINWCGDIDNDKKLDLIFVAATTSMNETTLFMSSKAKANEFIGKADNWTFYNCH